MVTAIQQERDHCADPKGVASRSNAAAGASWSAFDPFVVQMPLYSPTVALAKGFTGRYHIHESNRSFADVWALGTVENLVFECELSDARNPSDFEARMHADESASGFMHFHTINYGAWPMALGSSGKARMYHNRELTNC
jgi:hypothetical protein